MPSLLETLRARQLVTGTRPVRSLVRACHAGRLAGGLSVSLRATPDEVVGPLCHAVGGAARALKVLDVRGARPLELEVQWGEVHERWEVEDVAGLCHNLNDLFRAEPSTRAIAVLGEWEDMLQLWCVPRLDLPALLEGRVLEEARNVRALHRFAAGEAAPLKE
jgi:hypothetical protein